MRYKKAGISEQISNIPAAFLFFHQCGPGVPRLTCLFSSHIVTVLELIEDKGMEFCGVNLSVVGENCFFCFHIDNFAHNTGDIFRIKKVQKLTFHDNREFFNDRSVDLVAFDCRVAGTLKLKM